MNQEGQIRQGDILLVPVEVKPPNSAEVKTSVIMAEGEQPGHMHTLTADKIITWDDFVLVDGDEPGSISHPDHDPTPAPVVLPGQVYKVVRQREHTLDGQWSQVRD